MRHLSVCGDLRVNDRAGQSVAQGLPAILGREEAAVRALLHHEEDQLRPVQGVGRGG